MILFADPWFFELAIASAIAILLLKKTSEEWDSFTILIAFGCAVIWYVVFRDDPILPGAIFLIDYAFFNFVRTKKISKTVGVCGSLIPLLIAKVYVGLLPPMIGLSFITFRAIDAILYQQESDVINIGQFAIYLYFPLTLLAGPMYRWKQYKIDIRKSFQGITLENFLGGWELMLLGGIQKFGLAEAVNRFVLDNINAHDHSLRGVAINSISYSAFLYFDFAGYSNMAVGLGRMFGFDIPKNFDNPILSKNPQDFWRRWHISLSNWLRDVVFMPIYKKLSGMSRFQNHKLLNQNAGIMATLLIMGTWNGLQRGYIVSGLMFGAYSVAHNSLITYARRSEKVMSILSHWTCNAIGRAATIGAAILALYVFSGRSPI